MSVRPERYCPILTLLKEDRKMGCTAEASVQKRPPENTVPGGG